MRQSGDVPPDNGPRLALRRWGRAAFDQRWENAEIAEGGGEDTMKRIGTGALLAVVFTGSLALAVDAQDAEAVTCADVSVEEAQALLDADPTYETRSRLDADDNGIACDGGETGIGGGGRTAAGATPQADAAAVPAAQADPNGMPAVGVGAAASAVSPLLVAALSLASLGGAVAGLARRHG